MAEKHPELVVAFLKGMIKVGRWATSTSAPPRDPRQADLLPRRRGHLRGIKPIDLVPNLSPQNLVSVEIGKDFMLSHKYIKNDFDVKAWAAPEFLEKAARELLEQASGRRPPRPSCPRPPSCWAPASGSGSL